MNITSKIFNYSWFCLKKTGRDCAYAGLAIGATFTLMQLETGTEVLSAIGTKLGQGDPAMVSHILGAPDGERHEREGLGVVVGAVGSFGRNTATATSRAVMGGGTEEGKPPRDNGAKPATTQAAKNDN